MANDSHRLITSISSAALAAPPPLLRAHLAAQRLGAALNARSSGAMIFDHLARGLPSIGAMGVLTGFDDAASASTLADYASADTSEDPYLAEVARLGAAMHASRRPSEVRTFMRRELVPDDVWNTHPFVQRHHRALNIDAGLGSLCGVAGSDKFMLVFLSRPYDGPSFTEAERDMLHTLVERIWPPLAAELQAALTGGPRDDMGALIDRLSPAERELLPLVLSHLSETEIAKRVHRSRHTVHSHVKGIYGAAKVQSRVQLLMLWLGQPSISLGARDEPAPQR